MKVVADNLIALGSLITDKELTLYLMGGLGPKYDPVVVNLTSRNIVYSLEKTFSLLLTHKRRLE